jgi:hypothetical protein
MALKRCIYRMERPIDEVAEVEIVCLAGGNHRLGSAGSDPTYMDICGHCPIPDALTEEAGACLFLLPIRIFGEAGIETLYQCRFFYDVNPERADKSPFVHIPGACLLWFPHPIDILPQRTEWHTHRARALYLDEIQKPVPAWRLYSRRTPESSSRWQRLLFWITKKHTLMICLSLRSTRTFF